MGNCHNVAFNKGGRYAVVVGLNKEFVVLDIERNETDPPGQLFIK
jgi:hypothetical protein